MNATPLEKVLSAIGDYKRSGKGYKARCPAHQDRNPSLSIGEAEDGTVLVRCHSGCNAAAIVTALGLELRDLFQRVHVDTTPRNSKKTEVPSTDKSNTKAFPSASEAVANQEKRLGKRTAWWTYVDTSGNPVAVVVRWDTTNGKTFRPFAKTDSGWRIGDPSGPWPLYRLPQLLQSTGPVFVLEGEKAADALHALGFTVTTSAHGAKAAMRTDWTPLAGREVVILPDNDAAGTGYARAVVDLLNELTPKPRSIKIVNLPGLLVGGDVVDFIAERKGGGHE